MTGPHVTVLHGDATDRVRELDDGSVGAVVTSVPYWGQVDYTDDPAEHGRSGTPLAVWLGQIVAVFDALRPKLAADAAVWLNVGDTAVGSGGAGGDYLAGGTRAKRPTYRQGHSGLPRQGFALAPERLAMGLQDCGWKVRANITWDRSPIVPGGQYVREQAKHVKRPLRASERLFLLGQPGARLPRFDHDALLALPKSEQGDVWHFRPVTGAGRQARFPLELPARCLALTPAGPGELVLDPYAGEGATNLAAAQAGMDSVAIDIDPAAVKVGPLAAAGASVQVRLTSTSLRPADGLAVAL